MDVSFSAWRHSREESLQLKGDSFSFLFDRRYTNRLNRMSRVFFEAYVVATRELAMQEDRFPSLSEIDAKMESGAVYAFKDRLMKNTEFFEEVKISGVSYLVPRALRFVDSTGIYTDLILSFDDGTVILPTRRKTPLPMESIAQAPERRVASDTDDGVAVGQAAPATADQTTTGPSAPTEQAAPPQYPQPQYPQHLPEAFEEIEEPVKAPEPRPEQGPGPEQRPAPLQEEPARSPGDATWKSPIEDQKARQPIQSPVEAVVERKGSTGGLYKLLSPKRAGLLLALGLLITTMALLLPSQTPGEPISVEYSAYLSNSSNESYLGLDIVNSHSMSSDMEMALPPEIDHSISARGGIVTISHGENTIVRLNSSGDASVKIYLKGNWTTIPVGLSFETPEGFESSLQVHDKDYFVTRKNETSVLMFNLTGEGVRFEQIYTRKE